MVGVRNDMQCEGKMAILRGSFIPVGLVFFLTSFQLVSAQTGFLSIDCGALESYVDEKGISWVPDTAYMSVGSIANVSLDPSVTYVQGTDLTTLRYFPDTTRTKFCYVLPSTLGQTYLLRARFYHGGYDNHPTVKFNVSVDCLAQGSFSFTSQINYLYGESILQAANDNIQLCLFRTSSADNPFISSLELRTLDNTMYTRIQDGSGLVLQFRTNYGPATNSILRYPDDSYDRIWSGFSNSGLVFLNSTSVASSGFAVDKPPLAVMNTALTTNTSLSITYTPSFITDTYLFNIYLAELQKLTANQIRIFDLIINGVKWVSNVNVYSLAHNALYVPIEFTSNNTSLTGGSLDVALAPAANSTEGAFANAAEFYSITSKNLARTLASDVSAIESVKKAFGLMSWTGDPCLLEPHDWLNCSSTSPPRVSIVKLANYSLTGPIPSALGDLTNLTSLHLEDNKLTGSIPEWLASLPNLRELYLQNNDLSGNVPKALLSNSLLTFQYSGNPNLCVNTTCASGKSSKVGIIVGVTVGVLVAVALAVGLIVCCVCFAKKKNGKQLPSGKILTAQAEESTGTSRGFRYTLAQVLAATNNYEKVLGKGGFGPVYYGQLPNGQQVAVKVAKQGSGQGSREFLNEVELLTRIHHKNLVSLVGYCNDRDNLILLYEYMPNGTLQEHLYGVGEMERGTFLDWKTRLHIALNAAQGLEYLHVGCNPVIFHRDVKSNNILLTDKWVAKVADFGLSKSTNTAEKVTHVSTMVKGTIGYLDPEYFNTNQLTDKSDVYGFGIVLLELICGRPPFVPSLAEEQRRIDQWVRPHLQAGNIEHIVDRALGGQYNLDCMWKVADLAMISVEPKSVHRPKMSVIVQELRDALWMENGSSSTSIPIPYEEPPPFRFDVPESSTEVLNTRTDLAPR